MRFAKLTGFIIILLMLSCSVLLAGEADENWQLQLIAAGGGISEVNNFLGVSPKALDQYDKNDVPEPPAGIKFISLYFPHPDWVGKAGNYTKDLRASIVDKQTWIFEVNTSLINTDITISWQDLTSVPSDYTFILKDIDASQSFVLRSVASYTYNSGVAGGKRHFELLVDTPNDIPSITIIEPDGVADVTHGSYTIRWKDKDADSDATISLYYAEDTNFKGQLLAAGISEDDETDSYVWKIPNELMGSSRSYYIYAKIADESNPPTYSYSSGRLAVIVSQVIGPVSGTWTVEDSPYVVTGDIRVDAGKTLTIEPGVIVKFAGDYSFTVNGILKSQGAEDENIFFTSYKDDEHGGDTNGDGDATKPVSSDWKGIFFGDTVDNNNSIVEHTQVLYADYPITIYADYAKALGVGNSYFNNAPNKIKVYADTITKDAIWVDQGVPYETTGSITVLGKDGLDGVTTLTLSANITFEFIQNSYLYIGSASGDPGGLIVNGTATEPVIFTTNQPKGSKTRGYWYGIYFDNMSSDAICSLNYAVVEYAGYQWNSNIYCNIASPTITNSIIQYSSGYGIYCSDGSSPVISSDTFANNISYPIGIYGNFISSLGSGNTFSGNNRNAIQVFGDIITDNSTWKNQGVPYVISGSITIDGGSKIATLTLNPNVTLKFEGTYLQVGGNTVDDKAALIADGSAGKITFTSSKDDSAGGDTNGDGPSIGLPGDWGGVYFYDYSDDATSRLVKCDIKYGGSGSSANIYVAYASPTIKNSTISNSSVYGIYCLNGSSPQIIGNTITDNNNYGIYVNAVADDPIVMNNSINNNKSYPLRIGADAVKNITGNNFSGNTKNAIEVFADTIISNGTWTHQGVPYAISGNITIDGGDTLATLTLAPNVILKFNSGLLLQVGGDSLSHKGALVADGAEGTIIFTSYRDDSVGGDSNADGPSKGVPGDWYYISFRPYSDDKTSMLSNCEVRYGGYNSTANIYLTEASPTIANSIISNSSYYGIFCYNNSDPIISGNTIKDNLSYGVYCHSSNDDPTIADNSFKNNGNYPIYIGADAVRGVTSNTFSGNAKNAIQVFGEKITSNGAWTNQQVPYVISGDITIDGGGVVATLTLAANVILKFDGVRQFQVGGSSSNNQGALVADGTGGVIFFTSFKDDTVGGDTNADGGATVPAPGDWYGLRFNEYSDDGISKLINCEVKYGGYNNNAGIYLTSASPLIKDSIIFKSSYWGIFCYKGSSPQIEGNTIQSNNSYGIYANDPSDDPIIKNNKFMNNGSYAIRIGADAVGNLTDNTLSGNKNNAIEVFGETIPLNRTWTNQGAPYVIAGDITIDGGSNVATLTLASGVMLKFSGSRQIIVGGTTMNDRGALVADGSAEKIIFTSYRDDTVGGDTNADGDATKPAPGDWYGIYFYDYSDDATSLLSNVEMRYGGLSGWGIVYLDKASPTLNQCKITDSQYYGIRFSVSKATISGCTITDNRADGLYIDSSSPTIKDSIISSNDNYGIYLTSSSPTIKDSTISSNDNYGIYLTSSSPTITKSTISNNRRSGVYCTSNSDPVISETTITNNANYGIYADDSASQPNITNSTISGNGLYAAGMPAEAITKMMGGNNIFPENTNVEVRGGTLTTSGTWINDVVYNITSSVTVDPNVTLIIEAGAVIKLDDSQNMTIKGILRAVGAPDEQILFTSVRDTVASTSPDTVVIAAEGHQWQYLYFSNASPDSILDYTVVRYAASGVYCSNSSPTIIHSVISNNSENGIYCSTGSKPLVNYNNIANNFGYGVRNDDSNVRVNATNNWWGDATGPSGAGPGSGDKVSQYVDFKPWLTQPFKSLQVELKVPNGGENWQGGSIRDVVWSSSGEVQIDHIKLLYSTDGGATYPNVIVGKIDDIGSYSWNVPLIDSTTVKVKVIAEDSDGKKLGEDESDANFTIDSTAPIVSAVDSSVDDDTDETYIVGSIVRITVTEKNLEKGLSGTITITSETDDPGIVEADLTDAGDGKYYYDWDTSGRAAADDYQVETTLRDAAGNADSDGLPGTPDLTMTLVPAGSPFQYTKTSTAVFFHGTAKLFGEDLEVGDSIGAFVLSVVINDGCVGAFTITTAGQYGAMAVYGNDASTPDKDGADAGDTIYFRIWDASEHHIYEATAEGPNEPIWTSDKDVKNVNLAGYGTQRIPLLEGWNLISFSVNKCFYEGDQPTASIPDGVQMVDVVNELGFENMVDWFSSALIPNNPEWTGPAWQRVTSFDYEGEHLMDIDVPAIINTLKYMSVGYGYWVKVKEGTDGAILTIEGKRIVADAIMHLEKDWNLIGYLPSYTVYYDADVPSCPFPPDVTEFQKVSPPVTDTTLASIKSKFSRVTSFDCEGAHLYDITLAPEINTLHYMGTGYGCWIKMTEAADLTYPAENPSVAAKEIAASHPEWIGKRNMLVTPTNTSVFVYGKVWFDGIDAKPINVIRAYDVDGICCGVTIMKRGGVYGSMAVYGDDPTTNTDEGAKPGEPLHFTVNGNPAEVIGSDAAIWTTDRAVIKVNLLVKPQQLSPHQLRLPSITQAGQNYPNPFNPETWIPYQLSEATDVVIKIYDAGGQLVRVLPIGRKEAGFYLSPSTATRWDGRNSNGEAVASGIYFYQWTAGKTTVIKKMLVVK